MRTHPSITLERIVEAVESDEYVGFCIACGTDCDGVEPDAREYVCEDCEAPAVYGAQELLIMMAG